jgi:ABC-type branched-subunit amino acid transport system substrate-binding protein
VKNLREYLTEAVPAALVAAVSAVFGLYPVHQLKPEELLKIDNDKALFHVGVVGRAASWKGNDYNQAGRAVLLGANAATWDTHLRGGDRDEIEIRVLDDKDNNEDQAQANAKLFVEDPNLLAVIGPTSTGTAHATAEIYEEFGIPLIMPNVTGDFSTQPARRPTNCFRLMPKDSEYQAPAIADRILHGQGQANSFKKVRFVQAHAQGATMYSDALVDAIKRIIKASLGQGDSNKRVLVDESDSNMTDTNLTGIAQDIRNHFDDSTIIVFSGYEKDGERFLRELDRQYGDDLRGRPAIAVSDGCYNLEDQRADQASTAATLGMRFRIYRASAIDISACERGAQTVTRAQAAENGSILYQDENTVIKDNASPTPFIYGYDAMLIFSRAYQSCKSKRDISRSCILGELHRDGAVFPSSCFNYAFHDGDSVTVHYYEFPSVREDCLEKEAERNLTEPYSLCDALARGVALSADMCAQRGLDPHLCDQAYHPAAIDLSLTTLRQLAYGTEGESK